MSSEDMEKFQLRRPETPVAAKPDSKQAQRDQLIQDLQKFFQNGQQQDSQRTPRDQCLGQMCEQLTMLPPVPPPGRSGWWGGSPEPPRTPPSAC